MALVGFQRMYTDGVCLQSSTEGLLYLVHIKWNTYMYLESDIRSENLGHGITKFIVTRRPLQFPHRTEIRFLRHYHWKWMLLLLPVIHCPTQSPTSHFRQYVVVHFFTVFPVWLLLLSAHTRHERWDFPSSLACVAGNLYKKWSLPTSLPAGLLGWPCTWISVPALLRRNVRLRPPN
jgi:hypothetical protein